jgi:hypothetical protein
MTLGPSWETISNDEKALPGVPEPEKVATFEPKQLSE